MTALDPGLQSWVVSANDPLSDFPIQNLPFGVFRQQKGPPRIGVAIGDRIVDLTRLAGKGRSGPFSSDVVEALSRPTLNDLMALGRGAAGEIREVLSQLLAAGNGTGERDLSPSLIAMAEVEMLLPARIGDYTDFYASIHHATNVGSMFRPDSPLLPNYKYVPIGYHGRASSIVVSGTPVRRPSGQTRDDASAPPSFGPSRRLDYEMELGAYVATGNSLGEMVPLAVAEEQIFGVCLVNDWSARDIQTWEYQPLGPFLAKSFLTTVSPWVITLDALEPFRVPAFPRPPGDPAPLPYLLHERDQARGGLALVLEVWIRSAAMRSRGLEPMLVSRGSFASMYWTLGQLLTHHASNGCNLRPGDLIASGTVSGPTVESRGCLLERAWRGAEPLELPDGERRAFLHDGDDVIMRGYAERAGARRIGLGECRGRVSG